MQPNREFRRLRVTKKRVEGVDRDEGRDRRTGRVPSPGPARDDAGDGPVGGRVVPAKHTPVREGPRCRELWLHEPGVHELRPYFKHGAGLCGEPDILARAVTFHTGGSHRDGGGG